MANATKFQLMEKRQQAKLIASLGGHGDCSKCILKSLCIDLDNKKYCPDFCENTICEWLDR